MKKKEIEQRFYHSTTYQNRVEKSLKCSVLFKIKVVLNKNFAKFDRFCEMSTKRKQTTKKEVDDDYEDDTSVASALSTEDDVDLEQNGVVTPGGDFVDHDIDAPASAATGAAAAGRSARAAEPVWRKYRERAAWVDLVRREWCYCLCIVIGIVAVLLVGLLPMRLNEVAMYQDPPTWFTTMRVSCTVDSPAMNGMLDASTGSFVKLLPLLNVSESQVKIRRVNLVVAPASNTTTVLRSNSTTTTTAAAASPITVMMSISTTTIATTIDATTTAAANTNSNGRRQINTNSTMLMSQFRIEADITLNSTRNFTLAEFVYAFSKGVDATPNAFGSKTSIHTNSTAVSSQTPPAPKLPPKVCY